MDKIFHSNLGLGSWLTVLLAMIFIYLDLTFLILTIPFILAIGKETIDLVAYGKFNIEDIKSTIWPEESLKLIFPRFKEIWNKITRK